MDFGCCWCKLAAQWDDLAKRLLLSPPGILAVFAIVRQREKYLLWKGVRPSVSPPREICLAWRIIGASVSQSAPANKPPPDKKVANAKCEVQRRALS